MEPVATARPAGGRGRAAGRDRGDPPRPYLTGYRTIPAIGWLFLVQAITAFLLAAADLRRWWTVAAVSLTPGWRQRRPGSYPPVRAQRGLREMTRSLVWTADAALV